MPTGANAVRPRAFGGSAMRMPRSAPAIRGRLSHNRSILFRRCRHVLIRVHATQHLFILIDGGIIYTRLLADDLINALKARSIGGTKLVRLC